MIDSGLRSPGRDVDLALPEGLPHAQVLLLGVRVLPKEAPLLLPFVAPFFFLCVLSFFDSVSTIVSFLPVFTLSSPKTFAFARPLYLKAFLPVRFPGSAVSGTTFGLFLR